MFTSILKILTLSIISSRGFGLSNSVFPLNNLSNISLLSTETSIVENSFVPVNKSYVQIDQSDFLNGTMDNYVFPSSFVNGTYNTNVYKIHISYFNENLSQDTVTTLNCTNVRYDSSSNCVYFNYTGLIGDRWIDFNQGTLNYTGVGVGTIHYFKIESITSPNIAAEFYDSLADYLFDIHSISIGSFYLTNRVFIETAKYINTLTSLQVEQIYCECPQILTQTQYVQGDITDYSYTGDLLFYDDNGSGYLYLICDENDSHFGIWGYNGNYYLKYDIVLYFNDYSIYQGFLNAYQYDLDLNYMNFGADVFTFAAQFNYNQPYNIVNTSSLINDSYFTDQINNTPYVDKRYDMPIFKSNGYTFSAFVLRYSNAYGKYYMSDTYTYPIICNTQGFGYWSAMFYVRADGLGYIKVCERMFDTWTFEGVDNDVPQSYIKNQISWTNPSYKTMKFVFQLTNQQKDMLLSFNTLGDGLTTSQNLDLEQAFDLIDLGFLGLTGIFGTYILPGVSLATIILVPLAVTLILFIVRLFKR